MIRTLLPAGFALAACAACLSPARAQTNDTCAGAIQVALPSVTAGNTLGATTTSSLTSCGNTNDLWFKFIAPYTGTAEASTCGFLGGSANFDTIISTWSWPLSTPCTSGPFGGAIACNDDYCALQSYVSFPISYGHTYFISIGGYALQTGNFSLAVTAFPASPPNDFCAGAIPISPGSTVFGENAGANTGGGDPVATCGNMARDVWYSFVPTSCGTYTVTTCPSSNFDTVVAVWQGSCGSLTQLACNDDNCATPILASTTSFTGFAGTPYFISVGGYQGAYGVYALTVTGSGPPPPMALAFFNSGPGTIGYAVSNGPTGGSAFTAITLIPGAYPSGWFHGIDITIPDLVAQWYAGFPFVTPIGAPCTPTTVGPFGPLPSGLTVYGVAIAMSNPPSTFPTAFTPPASGTVP